MTRIGAIFNPYTHTPDEFRDAVLAAESSGLPELWIWEDCFRQSAFATVGAALAWTEALRIGIGIAPMPLRNVAATAMELATVERLFPGRLLPGVGHGVLDWMGQVGARAESPMTLLHEHTSAVRRLLDGETVSVDASYVHLDAVALDWPPERRPELLVGARGPRTIRLAGEVADGVLLDTITTPDVVGRARGIVDEARAASGRDGRARVYAYTPIDPTDDPAGLPDRLGDWAAELAEAGADTVIFQGTDDHPDARPLIEALTTQPEA